MAKYIPLCQINPAISARLRVTGSPAHLLWNTRSAGTDGHWMNEPKPLTSPDATVDQIKPPQKTISPTNPRQWP